MTTTELTPLVLLPPSPSSLDSLETVPAIVLTPTTDQQQRAKCCPQTVSILFTLLMSVLGAGMLSIPYAFTLVPVYAAIAIISIVGCTMSYTAVLLVRCYQHTGLVSYEQLSTATLGSTAATASSFMIALAIYGACVGSLMILRDVTPSIMSLVFLSQSIDSLTSTAFQLLLILVVLLPLCLHRQLSALRFSCILGFGFSLYLVVVVGLRAAFFSTGEHSDSVDPATANHPTTSIIGVTQATAIANFAFVMHLNVLPLFQEIQKTHSSATASEPWTRAIMSRIVIGTGMLCIVFYLCFGLSAFHLYGQSTNGNVLLNLNHDITMQIPRVAVFITVLTSFPMLFHPLRSLLERVCRIPQHKATVSTVALLGTQVAITWTASSIAVVFTLTGGTTVVGMCYVLPCLFFLRLVPSTTVVEKLVAIVIILSSTALGLVAALHAVGLLTSI